MRCAQKDQAGPGWPLTRTRGVTRYKIVWILSQYDLWNHSQDEGGDRRITVPEARSAEGCDASRSPPLVEAMTPFHTTNACAVITLGFGPSRGKLCLVVICQPGTLVNSTGHSQKRQPGRCIQSIGPHHPPNTPMLYPNISFADTPPPQKKKKILIK